MCSEKREQDEVDAVLNLSSHLKALAYCGTEECSGDDELMSLGNDNCSEDNDFVLSQTNYFQFNSEHQMDEPCSNNVHNTADTNECCSHETVKATHCVQNAEDSNSKAAEVCRKPCERTQDPEGTERYGDNEAVGSRMEPYLEKAVDANHLNTLRCSENLSEICDETSTVAHMLIGQILDKWLLMENGEVDKLTRHYLGGGLVSQSPQGTL